VRVCLPVADRRLLRSAVPRLADSMDPIRRMCIDRAVFFCDDLLRFDVMRRIARCTDCDGLIADSPLHCAADCSRVARSQVTKSMSVTSIKKRSKVKTFVKYVNYNHMMPTRYVQIV
jgi:hypothetical protein